MVEALFSVLELHSIEADRKQKLRFEKELISAKTLKKKIPQALSPISSSLLLHWT